MEKKKLKLKKETLSNLNKKEMEDIKGGRVDEMQQVVDREASLSVSISWSWSVTWSWSW